MDNRVTIIMRAGNIQKSDFISTFPIITSGDFYGITGIANIDKLHALYDAAVIDIRQGIMRLAKLMITGMIPLIFRLLQVQRTFINRSAGDGAHNAS